MGKVGKIILVIVIIALVGLVLTIIAFSLHRGGIYGLLDLMYGSQTVGEVTVNRRAGRVTITEVSTPGETDPLSPVVGKAYKIDRLREDGSPVRVEFSYADNEIPEGIDEENLSIFRWVENGDSSFWQPVSSQVDSVQNIVKAEVDSFSIMAVRAPVIYYLSEEDIAEMNETLALIMENVPEYTCGVFIIADEEMIVWNGSEIVETYIRSFSENTEIRDCAANPNTLTTPVSFNQVVDREKNGRTVQYTLHAIVDWQRDLEISARFTGNVIDQDGNPLPEINLVAEKIKYSPEWGETATGADGNFELNFHSGLYEVAVNSGGSAGGYKKNCSQEKETMELYAFGSLENYVPLNSRVNLSPFEQSFTLQCSDYYIDNTYELPVDVYVEYAQMTGIETHTFSGQQVEPAQGTYGWGGGTWEVDNSLVGKMSVGDMELAVPGLPGSMGFSTPGAEVEFEDFYQYTFTLPSDPKVGDTFTVKYYHPADAYQDKDAIEAGTSELGGNSFSPGTLTGEQDVQTEKEGTTTGKIVEILGDDGAVIELNLKYYDYLGQAPQAVIKKM